MKVAAAPESVPRPGARAALGIPEKDEEVHHRSACVPVLPCGPCHGLGGSLLLPNVFLPDLGMSLHILRQQVHAFLGAQVNHLDAMLAQPSDSALKVH